MSLEPVSRDVMRSLKAQKDEEARLKLINGIVAAIYANAINVAKTTTDTSYQYQLPRNYQIAPRTQEQEQEQSCVVRENMAEILSSLQNLFPGCSVEYTKLSRGHDGKMYNISKMDEKYRMLVTQQSHDYIVVDWS